MKVNDMVKVSLPGETPWAEVTEITYDGFKGRIDNVLVAEGCEFERRRITKHLFGSSEPMEVLHNYKFNDVVTFILLDDGDGFEYWFPKELVELAANDDERQHEKVR